MSLSVVYVPDTGHVVGAVNAIGAAPPADAGSLVGTALPMRVSLGAGEIAVLPLPSRDLKVHTADDEPAVFADPLAFGVEQVPGGDPKPALMRLASWSGGLSLTADRLVVTVPVANASQATAVLAWVSEGQDTLVLPGVIPAGKQTVELPVTVASGSPRGVLVLVAGWAGRLEKVPVTAP